MAQADTMEIDRPRDRSRRLRQVCESGPEFDSNLTATPAINGGRPRTRCLRRWRFGSGADVSGQPWTPSIRAVNSFVILCSPVTSLRTSVSAIVPAYNSELSLPELVRRLQPVLIAVATDYELI